MSRKLADFTDGLSNTLFASEGYIGHLQARNCYTNPQSPPGMTPTSVPLPNVSVATLKTLVSRLHELGQVRPEARPHPLDQRRRLLLGSDDRGASRTRT